MLSLGKFPARVQCHCLRQNLHCPTKSHVPFSDFHVLPGKIRSGFCLNALKTQNKVDACSSEMDGPDDFNDEFSEIEDGDEFVEGGDDDEVIIPLKNMKRWVKNRPRGFGEGKLYDTSVEEKLMEEIEQSRIAQLANVNNLKSTPVKPKAKKETSQQDKDIQNGFRVRLVNLPKKKNIHRDLQLAFKDIPGLVKIVPLVSGNEKTRDPVCKGLAFVDFKHKDEALRFVQNYSGQSISFGKVQKNITCEMMDPNLPKSAHNQSDDRIDRTFRQTLQILDQHSDALSGPREESALTEYNSGEERHLSTQSQDDREIKETSSSSKSNPAKEPDVEEESATNSSSSKQRRKLKPEKKKVAASKTSKFKVPKLNIPGSANRLKIKDKALLSGVFSKYGSNVAALNVKETSK